jgi:hypothetical protein
VVRSARVRRSARTWEEWLMSTLQNAKARSWLGAALAGGLAAIALLVIPISYEKTTGHSVKLEVSGPGLSVDGAMGIARQLKSVLGDARVSLSADETSGGTHYTMSATVPAEMGARASAVAQAFAGTLTAKGYLASAETHAIKERVSSNVYAYARDRVIQVSLDGKTAAQIQAEIQKGLADAGITDAQVSVTQEGNPHEMGIKIQAEHIAKAGEAKSAEEPKEIPQLVLTKNGAPVGEGKGFQVRIAKMRGPDGTTLVLDVTQDGKAAQAKVAHSEGMADAALAAAIQEQLDHAGLSVTVAVKDGGVEIKPKK